MYIYQPIGIMVQVFASSPGEGFNPSLSHTKDLRMVFDASLHNTQYNKVCIKGKNSNPGKEVAFSSKPCVVAIEKGAQVSLDYR